MVFNSVFFETNESGELAYFARPQKISKANYLFADIMNIYSQKNNNFISVKSDGKAVQGGEASDNFPLLTGSIDASSVDKLIGLIKNLIATGKSQDVIDGTDEVKIDNKELKNLLMQISDILGKNGNQQVSVKGVISELQRKISSGSNFSLLLVNGKTELEVVISGEKTSGDKAGEKNYFVLAINDVSAKPSGNKESIKKNNTTGEKIHEGSYAISVITPTSSDVPHVTGKVSNVFSKGKSSLKASKVIGEKKKTNILHKSEFTSLLKETSDFVKEVKALLSQDENLTGKSLKVIEKKLNSLTGKIGKSEDGILKEKLGIELKSFIDNLSELQKDSAAPKISGKLEDVIQKLNQLPGGNISAKKYSALLSEVKTELSKMSKDFAPQDDVLELKNKLVNLSSKIETEVKTTGKISSNVVNEVKEILSGIKGRKVSELTNLNKNNSVLDNIFTDLNVAREGLSELKNNEPFPKFIYEKLKRVLKNLDKSEKDNSAVKSEIVKITNDLKHDLKNISHKLTNRTLSEISKNVDSLIDKISSINDKEKFKESVRELKGKTDSYVIESKKIKEIVTDFEKKAFKVFSEEGEKFSGVSNQHKSSIVHGDKVDQTNGAVERKENIANASSENGEEGNIDYENKGRESQNQSFAGNDKGSVHVKSDFRSAFIERVDALPTNTPNVMREKFANIKMFSDLSMPTVTKEELIKNFSAIIEKAKEKSITLQLHPDNLGKVKVTLSVAHNQAVQANIQVENHIIKQFMENNLSQLYAQMGKTGVQFSSVNVSVSQNPFTKDSNSNGSHQKKGKGKYSNVEDYAPESENGSIRAFGYNTYEYLA